MKLIFTQRILGIGISILVLGAGCSSSYTPATSPFANLPVSPAEAVTQQYMNTDYGFSFNYPEAVQVLEQGPNDAQKDYETQHKLSDSAATPLLTSLTVQRKNGEIIMVIKVPNTAVTPVISTDGTWNTNVCGAGESGTLSSPEHHTIGGKNARKVITTYTETGIQEIYHCIASSPYPLVLISPTTEQPTVENILHSFIFTTSTMPTSTTIKK